MQFEELELAIENETSAIEFAVRRNLLPEKRTICPKCCVGHVGWYKRSNEKLKVPFSLRCSRKRCRKKWSVTKNTWFFGSHLSVRQHFMLIYFWIRGDSIAEAAEKLKLSKTTVMDYYQFCREVCFVIVSNRTKPIGGQDHTVVINEFQVDRVIATQRRRVFFLEGVDQRTNDCFLLEIQRHDAQTIVPLLRTFVLEGSKVITNTWESYNRLNTEEFQKGLLDFVVEYVELDTPDGKTQKVKCMWRTAKRFIDSQSEETDNRDFLLFQYLYFHPIEYLSTGEKFDRFLEDISKVYPGPFKHPLTAVVY